MERKIWVLPDAIAVTEDGRLAEYIPMGGEESRTEAILLGRVVRVVKGMQAAFVDIGQEKNGFLPLKENSASFSGPELRDGMHVPVQVKKDAHGTKGAFLTRDITLCGALVLVMPMNRFLGVSSRIDDEHDRKALKQLADNIAGDRFGLVMREASLNASPDDIREEAEELYARWQQTARDAAVAHCPSVVYQPRTPLQALLDDLLPRGVTEIVTWTDMELHTDVPVRRIGEDAPELAGIRREMEKALQRRVWLDCGANLIIDPCEAMTVIDVNTARFTGKRELEETLLRADLEAAREIAHQVRLRNLSGIILIDMIDLQEQQHRDMVLENLREAFREDRIKTVVHGFTSLGLIEMTRKKSRASLMEACTSPCPHCGGSGHLLKEDTHG